MGITTITTGVSWQPKEIANEYISAINERGALVWPTLTYTPNVARGNSLNSPTSHVLWYLLQSYIAGTLATKFMSLPYSALAVTTALNTTPLDTSSLMWTEASFLAYLPGGHFRRKQTMAAGFSYGYMQSGDIIGPWIFEDLATAMRNCKYVIGNNNALWDTANSTGKSGSGTITPLAAGDLAATKAAAVAAFAADHGTPCGFSTETVGQGHVLPPPVMYCTLQAMGCRAKINLSVAATVDWWAKASAPSANTFYTPVTSGLDQTPEWDAGSSGLTQDAYVNFSTGNAGTTSAQSDVLGSDTQPPWPTNEVSDPGGGSLDYRTAERGWVADANVYYVIEYTGFVY